jgi:hypothetical protein
MQVKHLEIIHARCPMEPAVFDYYEVAVEADRTIDVESIRAALVHVAGEIIFQEALTQRLADAINAKVTTSGLHRTTRTEVACTPLAWLTAAQ